MKSFEHQAIVKSFLPDVFGAIVVFLYAIFSTRIPMGVFVKSIKVFIFLLLFFQFVLALITDHFCYNSVSTKIKSFYSSRTTETERTHLFDDIIQYPFYTALMTFFYFFAGTAILAYYFFTVPKLPLNITGLFFIEALFGTYFASLFGFTFCSKIVSKISIDIISAGIEKDYVMKKKFFGIKLNMKVFLFVALPCIFTCVINCAVVIAGYYPFNRTTLAGNGDIQNIRMLNTIVINTVVMFISIFFLYSDINKKNTRMTEVLNDITSTDFTKITPIETDISDELSFNHYLANHIISMFRGILFQTEEFGKTIGSSASELMRIANETESTSVEQSTGIKEIVSTMENATNLSHNIENRIIEVTEIAKKTVEKVNSGSELLDKSLFSIDAIDKANEVIIEGIKNLNNIINSIWEIANIIDSISDQTKIIAFNAELEAVSNGKNGRNFHIVATEIRRLANNTMDSIQTIQNYTESIQDASRDLITSSEQSTETIHEEAGISKQLETQFGAIMESSNETNEKATEISGIIEQQTASFNQIVVTLRQISSGIESFAQSTKTITNTVNEMKNIAFKLSNMKDNI